MTFSVSYSPSSPLNTQIKLDGSKSISNRLLMLKALSESAFDITNLSTSDDTVLMQAFIDGFPENTSFNVHNAVASQPGQWELQCAEPMKKRPIKILVDALRKLGATINYTEQEGYLPLHIEGQLLTGNYVSIPADVSSQYISALMMIAPTMPNGLTIELEGVIASRPYLEITIKNMQQCGAQVSFEGQQISIKHSNLDADSIFCESDWSAAAFYYTMVALQDNAALTLSELLNPNESTQGDAAVAKVYEQLGVQSLFEKHEVKLEQMRESNAHFQENFFDKPDMVPAVAVTCAALGIPGTFTGVRNLVIKESNRLEALKQELEKVDVKFYAINEDEWKLEGQINAEKIKNTRFYTYEDHRIAMAFATLAAKYDRVLIEETHVVSKSYPAFWDDLKTIGFQIETI